MVSSYPSSVSRLTQAALAGALFSSVLWMTAAEAGPLSIALPGERAFHASQWTSLNIFRYPMTPHAHTYLLASTFASASRLMTRTSAPQQTPARCRDGPDQLARGGLFRVRCQAPSCRADTHSPAAGHSACDPSTHWMTSRFLSGCYSTPGNALFVPSCSLKSATDLFPNRIDAIQTERLMPFWWN
jgi:hypothetical protein